MGTGHHDRRLRNTVTHTDCDSDRDRHRDSEWKPGNTDTFAFGFTRGLFAYQWRAQSATLDREWCGSSGRLLLE